MMRSAPTGNNNVPPGSQVGGLTQAFFITEGSHFGDAFGDAEVTTGQDGPAQATAAPVGPPAETDGSMAIRNDFRKMRDAAPAAGEMMFGAATNSTGNQNRSNFTVPNGIRAHVPNALPYADGQVAAVSPALPPRAGAPLVPDSQIPPIGKTQQRFDIPSKVDGSAKYGIDIQLPNMVYAVVRHSPTFGGTLANTPPVPHGMLAVVPIKVIEGTNRGTEAAGNLNAVAVVGPNTWDTWQAARALRLKWNIPAAPASLSDDGILAQAQALAASATPYEPGATNGPGTLYTVEGSSAAAASSISGSATTIDATYTLPYVAEACMEVLNCTVDYQAGVKCEIYAPTQSAKSVLSLATTLTGLSVNRITVHSTYPGGGLGRKAAVDFVSQAIQVGMAIGKPVKMMWPHEEDVTQGQYPMALIHVKAGLDPRNNITGWAYRTISPSILAQCGAVLGATGDSQGCEGSEALPYELGARVTEYVTHPSPIPFGFWRSDGAAINTFAVESMIDELAVAAGRDPYRFRRGLLTTNARWVAVLDAAAKLAGWDTTAPAGHYRGIAIGTAFHSIVAQVVEISDVTATGFAVCKSSIALDCYLAVNPEQVEAQLTGGLVHGLNAALYGRQDIVQGAAKKKRFCESRMIRPGEMPQIAVTLIPNPAASDRTVGIGGVGELGVPTFTPALAGAYYRATRNRVRSLPFFPNAVLTTCEER